MKGVQGERGAKGVKGRRGPPVRHFTEKKLWKECQDQKININILWCSHMHLKIDA